MNSVTTTKFSLYACICGKTTKWMFFKGKWTEISLPIAADALSTIDAFAISWDETKCAVAEDGSSAIKCLINKSTFSVPVTGGSYVRAMGFAGEMLIVVEASLNGITDSVSWWRLDGSLRTMAKMSTGRVGALSFPVTLSLAQHGNRLIAFDDVDGKVWLISAEEDPVLLASGVDEDTVFASNGTDFVYWLDSNRGAIRMWDGSGDFNSSPIIISEVNRDKKDIVGIAVHQHTLWSVSSACSVEPIIRL